MLSQQNRRGTKGIGLLCTLAIATGLVAGVVPRAVASATPFAVAPRSDGIVAASGVATFAGSPGAHARAPLVGIAGISTGRGYWVARADGGVYHFGTAGFFGSVNPASLASPVIGIAAHPSGRGYWLVTSAGRIYPFGAAHSYGQPFLGASPVVAIAATPTGRGYWVALADGGVFAFGDAPFRGSAFGGIAVHGGAVAFAATPSGNGYWIVARNGGLFPYGDAANLGSPWPSATPMAGIAPTRSGAGYVIVDVNGRTHAYGDAGSSTRVMATGAAIVGPEGRVQYRPPSSNRTDTSASVLSVPVTVDRRTVSISAAFGFHSFWTLNTPLADSAVIAAPGARGSVVSSVQRNLLARGYWLLPTGVYDSVTLQAVWAFQKANLRSRTGVITAGDYRALLTSGRPRPRTSSGYVAELDKTRQILILARNGRADWVFNTSTGTEKPYVFAGVTSIAHTPTGHFSIIRQVDGLRVGRLGSLWRPKYFTPDGVAFHGSASIPPYPASHGCSRLSNQAIDYIWAANALPLGTAVWVY